MVWKPSRVRFPPAHQTVNLMIFRGLEVSNRPEESSCQVARFVDCECGAIPGMLPWIRKVPAPWQIQAWVAWKAISSDGRTCDPNRMMSTLLVDHSEAVAATSSHGPLTRGLPFALLFSMDVYRDRRCDGPAPVGAPTANVGARRRGSRRAQGRRSARCPRNAGSRHRRRHRPELGDELAH